MRTWLASFSLILLLLVGCEKDSGYPPDVERYFPPDTYGGTGQVSKNAISGHCMIPSLGIYPSGATVTAWADRDIPYEGGMSCNTVDGAFSVSSPLGAYYSLVATCYRAGVKYKGTVYNQTPNSYVTIFMTSVN